jgi:hypothetical protein
MRAPKIKALANKGFENKGQTRNAGPRDPLLKYSHKQISKQYFEFEKIREVQKNISRRYATER